MFCFVELLRHKMQSRCIDILIATDQHSGSICFIVKTDPFHTCQIATILRPCKWIEHLINRRSICPYPRISLSVTVTFIITISIPRDIFCPFRKRQSCSNFNKLFDFCFRKVEFHTYRYRPSIFDQITHFYRSRSLCFAVQQIGRIPFRGEHIITICTLSHRWFPI